MGVSRRLNVIFPKNERPSVRHIGWRDVQYEGHPQGALYVLILKGQPACFSLSRGLRLVG